MMNDHELAAHIARGASNALLELQQQRGISGDPQAIAALKDAGDQLAHTFITEALAKARPGDAVMSEEGDWQNPDRLGVERLWIVDPLDATKEYGLGIADWAVQIALLEDGQITAAAMDLGGRDVRWSTADAPHVEPVVHDNGTLIAVVSRSRSPENLDAVLAGTVDLLQSQGVQRYVVRTVGGVGGKVDEVLAHRAHLYVGPTWCYEWDAAAPVAIAAHHGFHVCDVEGAPLRFNKPGAEVEGLLVGPAVSVSAFVAARRNA